MLLGNEVAATLRPDGEQAAILLNELDKNPANVGTPPLGKFGIEFPLNNLPEVLHLTGNFAGILCHGKCCLGMVGEEGVLSPFQGELKGDAFTIFFQSPYQPFLAQSLAGPTEC